MLATAICLLVFASQTASQEGSTAETLEARAGRLLREVPLIDGHNDLPWHLRENYASSFDGFDLRQRHPQKAGHTDIPRLREGGVGGQFWSVYVPTNLKGDAAVRATLEQIDIVHRLLRLYPDAFELAATAEDVVRSHAAGRIGSLMGVEGGHQINGSLATLRMFHRLGVRYMTLTHSDNVPWADSGTDAAQANGLTEFGESVVREMNRMGMLVDLSHTSEPTVRHVLRIAKAPVIFSHSSCRALTDHPRNVSDDVLRALPANGGVIMITFVPAFTSLSAGDRGSREMAERLRLEKEWGKGDPRIDNAMRTWSLKNPRPKSSLRAIADHVEHARRVAGADHVGLGSDFDGIGDVPEGLEDVSRFKDLVVELLRRGWSDGDVRKLLGENLLRVMRAAEKAAEPVR